MQVPQGPDVVMAVGAEAAVAVELARAGVTRALVLLNPAPNGVLPEVPLDVDAEIQTSFDAVPDVIAAIESGDVQTLIAALTQPARHVLPREESELVTQVITDNIDRFADPLEYTLGKGGFWPDLLGTLSVPVLVVAQTLTPRPGDLLGQYAEALVARCPSGTLKRLEAQTDFPWLERPAALAGMINEFCAGIGPRSSK